MDKLNVFAAPAESRNDMYQLFYFKYADIKAFLPEGIAQDPLRNTNTIFLGIDQAEPTDVTENLDTWNGDIYWGVEISGNQKLVDYAYANSPEGADFVDLRMTPKPFSRPEASIGSTARSLLDWHKRYKHCSDCGRKLHSVWGGWKLQCDADEHSDPPCFSKSRVQNYNYPRYDPVIITAILSNDRSHILLGRKSIYPAGMYSCIAGFLEPGESIEEAVKREAYEETGIRVDDVIYYSSQPWPYPSTLMLGCFAVASSEQPLINLQIDEELEDAKFFTRDEVRDSLTFINEKSKPEYDRDLDIMPDSSQLNIKLPPPIAIANRLINAWVNSVELPRL